MSYSNSTFEIILFFHKPCVKCLFFQALRQYELHDWVANDKSPENFVYLENIRRNKFPRIKLKRVTFQLALSFLLFTWQYPIEENLLYNQISNFRSDQLNGEIETEKFGFTNWSTWFAMNFIEIILKYTRNF